MRIHHIKIGVMGQLAVLAIGYSRMTADEERDVRLYFGLPADIPMKDLGVVELRAGIPKRVHVGWGKYCTISATRADQWLQVEICLVQLKNRRQALIKNPEAAIVIHNVSTMPEMRESSSHRVQIW